MNLQAKRSVFRSRKSQQPKHAHASDAASAFLSQLKAGKKEKRR
jgi:hypothetical protein